MNDEPLVTASGAVKEWGCMVPITDAMVEDDMVLRIAAEWASVDHTPEGVEVVEGSVTYEIPERAHVAGTPLPPLPGEWPGPVLVVRWQVRSGAPRGSCDSEA